MDSSTEMMIQERVRFFHSIVQKIPPSEGSIVESYFQYETRGLIFKIQEDWFDMYYIALNSPHQNLKSFYSRYWSRHYSISRCLLDRFDIHWSDCLKLLGRKNLIYGSAHFIRTGEIGIIVRMIDKLARLRRLLDNPELDILKDETIKDTVMDYFNYVILGFGVTEKLL